MAEAQAVGYVYMEQLAQGELQKLAPKSSLEEAVTTPVSAFRSFSEDAAVIEKRLREQHCQQQARGSKK